MKRWLGVLMVVGLDQGVKWWWQGTGGAVMVNTGMVRGVLAIGLLIYLAFRREKGWWLVMGGGMSNLVDRWFYGGVRDMWRLGDLSWFNLADVAIVMGAIWMLK